MKALYVILIFLFVFNSMLLVTESMNIFPSGTYTGVDADIDFANVTGEAEITQDIWGTINLETIITAGIGLAGTIGLAYLFKSPVPVGVGLLVTFFVTMWVQLYTTLDQFAPGVVGAVLGIGIACMSILLFVDVIDRLAPRGE